MSFDLKGKSFLVTGASGGIGSAVAATLARQGADVALHYHRARSAAESLAQRLQEEHRVRSCAYGADLRSESEVAGLFERSATDLGRLDGLVANAGVWVERSIPLHRVELSQWRDTLDVNLTGTFLCCRELLRQLDRDPREHAAIVLVGSTAALFGEEGHGDYAASKAALSGLCLTLKNEIVRLAPRGRVNLIQPGWVSTPMAAGALADESRVDRVTSTMALRKVATPEDIAGACAFLLSDRLAGHITGLTLPIAGGMEGRLLHPPADERAADR